MVLEVLGFNACRRIIHVSCIDAPSPIQTDTPLYSCMHVVLILLFFPSEILFAFLVCCLVLKTHAMSLTHVLTYPCLCTYNIAFLKVLQAYIIIIIGANQSEPHVVVFSITAINSACMRSI